MLKCIQMFMTQAFFFMFGTVVRPWCGISRLVSATAANACPFLGWGERSPLPLSAALIILWLPRWFVPAPVA